MHIPERVRSDPPNQDLSIVPLDMGTFTHLEKSTLTYLANQGVKIRGANIMWYIDGASQKIVVDTGPSNVDWSERYHHPLERDETEWPDTALKSIGVDPESVDVVVCTHLHWDHCHGLRFFPRARLVVQRTELQYAVAPLSCHRVPYDLHTGAPPFLHPDVVNRFETISGDTALAPGVTLLHTPGHTPGMQAVAVDTKSGTYVIASDTVALFACWEAEPPIPNGIHVDLETYYRTLSRLREIADFVLPGHDMAVFNRQRYS